MIARVAFASALLAIAGGSAWAQQSMRVAGTVASFDGRVLAINSAKLGEVKINLTDNVAVFGVTKATLTDIKPGAHVAIIRAMKKPDDSLEANRVNVGCDGVVPR